MDKQAALAIIIVSWNVKDLLQNCLTSVLADSAAANLPVEIWVVDNASSDNSTVMVQAEFPDVKLIAGESNLGFAGGNNVDYLEIALLAVCVGNQKHYHPAH